MSLEETYDFIDMDILSCGTAQWMAELAGKLKNAHERLENDNLKKAYEIVRDQICWYASIQDEHRELLDAVIDKYYKHNIQET